MTIWKSVGESVAQQTEETYADYNKLKTLVDLGFFLKNYVVNGGVVTKDIYRNDEINVTYIVASLDNDVTQREGKSFKTKISNTTYYLDYQAGDFRWSTSHPIGSYLPIAEVTTDDNRNVSVITDKRGRVGGFWLKDDYMYPEIAALQADVVQRGINIKSEPYNAVMDGETDDTAAFNAAVTAAIASGAKLIIPAGTLVLTSYPSTLRQETIVSTLDLGNLVIEGVGRETIIKGVSDIGFDVFQLNGVKNLTIKNLSITSVKLDEEDTTHGCNGISMTNGTSNITVDNVYVYDLPYVVKTGEGYVDGGKAFTVQQGELGVNNCSNIVVRNCESYNCPFGFGMDIVGTYTYVPDNIRIEGNTFDAFYQGVYVSVSAPESGSFVAKTSCVIQNNVVIGAQQSLVLSRGSGIMAVNNQFFSTKTATPMAISFDTVVCPIVATSCENCTIANNFTYYAKCDHYMKFGGSSSGGSRYVFIAHNEFTGNTDGGGIAAINAGGNIAIQCTFIANYYRNLTTFDIDPLFVRSIQDNVVIKDSRMQVNQLILNTSLGLVYTDDEVYHTFFRDGSAFAFKQTASSAGAHVNVKIKSDANADVFGVRNDGGILTASVESNVVPDTQNKRVPWYDASGNFVGYMPLYNV